MREGPSNVNEAVLRIYLYLDFDSHFSGFLVAWTFLYCQ